MAEVWEKQGAKIIRADLVGHEVLELEPVKKALRQRFGDGVFSGEKVDRRALAERVFSSPEDLEFLNRLTHPEIRRIIGERLKKERGLVVIEAALLFEIGLDEFCHFIVATYCSPQEQRRRLLLKGYTPEQGEARRSAQKSPEFCASRADLVINTEGSIETVREKAEEILKQIKEGKWALKEAKWK